jgi:beta-glucosidase
MSSVHQSLCSLMIPLLVFNPVLIVKGVFPQDFKFGAAIAAYQNCGAGQLPHSTWAKWEEDSNHIKDGQKSGSSCNHWNLYKEDIKLMQELGLNSFRFSVDWSVIEPQEGEFNQAALDYYNTYCEDLIEAGIAPLITLHHFSHPQWFEDLGAFEKEKNIAYFVRFSKKVFEVLGDKVTLWCTINEPTIYVFQGYIRGVFPPGKVAPVLGLTVLRNLMQAHTEVYLVLKEMAGDRDVQIGFVHQYLMFHAYHPWHVVERIPGYFINYLLNDTVIKFCQTGVFEINLWAPKLISLLLPKGIEYLRFPFILYETPTGKRALDFIGLNYYSRVLIRHQPTLTNPFNVVPSCYDGEIMTDMPYPIFGKGLYDAIVDLSKLGLPIYITENGIADSQEEDTNRRIFLKDYLTHLEQAVKEKFNVKGYYYWTLTDNFEWDEGFNMCFGLHKVDFATQKRTLRKGSEYYRDFIKQARALIVI